MSDIIPSRIALNDLAADATIAGPPGPFDFRVSRAKDLKLMGYSWDECRAWIPANGGTMDTRAFLQAVEIDKLSQCRRGEITLPHSSRGAFRGRSMRVALAGACAVSDAVHRTIIAA